MLRMHTYTHVQLYKIRIMKSSSEDYEIVQKDSERLLNLLNLNRFIIKYIFRKIIKKIMKSIQKLRIFRITN